MLVGSACSHYLMTVSVRSLQLAVVKLFCFSVSQFTAWLSFSLSFFFFYDIDLFYARFGHLWAGWRLMGLGKRRNI